jgi:hypothetical protein
MKWEVQNLCIKTSNLSSFIWISMYTTIFWETMHLAGHTIVFYYTNKQGHGESNADYLNKFKDMCQVIEHYRGSLCDNKAMIEQEEVTIQLKQ